MEEYFVHFIAPEDLPPMPKHVVFVLDTSGRLVWVNLGPFICLIFYFSMRHRKMQQTIAAMVTILGEMRSKDYIGCNVCFSPFIFVIKDKTLSCNFPVGSSQSKSWEWIVQRSCCIIFNSSPRTSFELTKHS